jgi:hypothetical protein
VGEDVRAPKTGWPSTALSKASWWQQDGFTGTGRLLAVSRENECCIPPEFSPRVLHWSVAFERACPFPFATLRVVNGRIAIIATSFAMDIS